MEPEENRVEEVFMGLTSSPAMQMISAETAALEAYVKGAMDCWSTQFKRHLILVRSSRNFVNDKHETVYETIWKVVLNKEEQLKIEGT